MERNPDREEAERLMRSGYGHAELDRISRCVAPIFWANDSHDLNSASVSFVDTGGAVIGLTAAHVLSERVHGVLATKERDATTYCKIRHLPFPIWDRLIDIDERIDIATFSVRADELEPMHVVPLDALVGGWPPRQTPEGCSVLGMGFPAIERSRVEAKALRFLPLSLMGLATSVSERDICTQIERENIVDVGRVPVPGFLMGGISGGLLVTPFNLKGLLLLEPSAVIVEGGSGAHLELIRGRQLRFVRADGSIDRDLWEQIA